MRKRSARTSCVNQIPPGARAIIINYGFHGLAVISRERFLDYLRESITPRLRDSTITVNRAFSLVKPISNSRTLLIRV